MFEEVEEYQEAFYKEDLPEMGDALADLIWFAIGAALLHGIDLRPVMDEVHKSNMTKSPDPNDYKNCIKGPDFKKPDLKVAFAKGQVRHV
jgi:predicted HAD superfamily Cof-like phosphohydrolase